MKLRYFLLPILVLFLAVSLLQAQHVKPASLTIDAIPGDTSPRQEVRFSNTGNSELALTISIIGPFGLPKNECGHPVKPSARCSVWVNYSPQQLGTDSGTLTFTFNDQTVSVLLTGNAVNLFPTSTRIQLDNQEIKTTVSVVDGYEVPDNELVRVGCTAVSGPYRGYDVSADSYLLNSVAYVPRTIVDVLGGHYMWHCHSLYFGDTWFGSSESREILVWSYR